MSKMLLIVSAVFLLASAALGFVNKTKIAAKQDEIVRKTHDLDTAKADATTAKTKQKKAEKDASDAVSKSNELQTSLSAATDKVTDLNNKVEEATKKITANEADITRLNETIANLGIAGKSAPTNAGPDLATQLQEAQIQLAELKTVREQTESQLKSAQTETIALKRQIAARADGSSMNGLSGRILAVNHDWNFVILSLGNRNGVNSNATMIVQRGGSTVGKVRITSVEPSQSVADIVPNSVPAGINVQPGDTVIYPGS